MRYLILLLLVGAAMIFGSCTVWIDHPYDSDHHDDDEATFRIESNTSWTAEIDGEEYSGHGDRTFYVDADCARVEKNTSGGYIRLTYYCDCERPQTSYTDADYGSVRICD